MAGANFLPAFLVHTNIGYVVIQKVYTFSDSPLLILGLPFLITFFAGNSHLLLDRKTGVDNNQKHLL